MNLTINLTITSGNCKNFFFGFQCLCCYILFGESLLWRDSKICRRSFQLKRKFWLSLRIKASPISFVLTSLGSITLKQRARVKMDSTFSERPSRWERANHCTLTASRYEFNRYVRNKRVNGRNGYPYNRIESVGSGRNPYKVLFLYTE